MGKKVEKYVPQTKYPKNSLGHRKILERAGTTPEQYIGYLRERHNNSKSYKYWTSWVAQWDRGVINSSNFFDYW